MAGGKGQEARRISARLDDPFQHETGTQKCVQELGERDLADADSATNAVAEAMTAPVPSGYGIPGMDYPAVAVTLDEVAYETWMRTDVREPPTGPENTCRLAENWGDVVHVRVKEHRSDGVEPPVHEWHRRGVRLDELFGDSAYSMPRDPQLVGRLIEADD
jgi:hypothetical protein